MSPVVDGGTSYPAFHYSDGNFKEMDQIRSGFLSANTTLVMLSIGGNDAGFAPVIQGCVAQGLGAGDCSSDPNFLPPKMAKTDQVVSVIRSRIQDVAVRAPSAAIVLMGCPRLLTTDQSRLPCVYGIQRAEEKALNKLADHFAEADSKMVTDLFNAGVNVHFADPRPRPFFADHGVCDPAPDIHSIQPNRNGPGDFPVNLHLDYRVGCFVAGCSDRSVVVAGR